MTHSQKTILVTAGGSGGHLYPAWAYIQALKEKQPDTKVFLMVDRETHEAWTLPTDDESCRCEVLPVMSAQFLGLKSLLSVFFWGNLIRGFWKASRWIKVHQPDVVIGFGGYAAFPVMLAAICSESDPVTRAP